MVCDWWAAVGFPPATKKITLLDQTGKWAQLWLRERTRKSAETKQREGCPRPDHRALSKPRGNDLNGSGGRGFQLRAVWGPAGKAARKVTPFRAPGWAPRAPGREQTGTPLAPAETLPPRAGRKPRSLHSATLTGTSSGPPGLRPGSGSSGAPQRRLTGGGGAPRGTRLPRGPPPPPASGAPCGHTPERATETRLSRPSPTGRRDRTLLPPREPPRPSTSTPLPLRLGTPHLPAQAPVPRLTWRVGRAGQGRAAGSGGRARAGRGRAPGAGGGGGGSGCCRYSCLSVQLLLRRRLLPSRGPSGVARRGRTKARLPSESPRWAPVCDVGRGEAPVPRLRASLPPRPSPTWAFQVRTRPRGAGARSGWSVAAARLFPPRSARLTQRGRRASAGRSTSEDPCPDLVTVVTS